MVATVQRACCLVILIVFAALSVASLSAHDSTTIKAVQKDLVPGVMLPVRF